MYSYLILSQPGVPLSTQWGPQGYFYAIQIAQYGLSHYSKNLTERPPHVEIYDTAEERDSRAGTAPWSVPKGCSLSRAHDKLRATSVRQFSAQGTWYSLRAQMAPGQGAYLWLSVAVRRPDTQLHSQDRRIVCSEAQLHRLITVGLLLSGWAFQQPSSSLRFWFNSCGLGHPSTLVKKTKQTTTKSAAERNASSQQVLWAELETSMFERVRSLSAVGN